MTTLSQTFMQTVPRASSRIRPGIVLFVLLLFGVTLNQSEESITAPTLVPPSIETLAVDKFPSGASNPCLYAEEELCKTRPANWDPQAPCQCQPHATIPGFLVCCNITDISQIVSCASSLPKDNATTTGWQGIHVRNATMKALNVSHTAWKQLRSLSITDGNISKITNEFRKFSAPKCLNVSNNNLKEIYPRAFTNLTHLQVLDMSYNNLSRIPNLSVQTNLTVNIYGNKFVLCDSVLDSLDRSTLTYIETDSTSCLLNQSVGWFESMDKVPLTQLYNMKQLTTECPVIPGHGNCTCEKDQMAFELKDGSGKLKFRAKVDCSGLGLTELPRLLPSNTYTLNVSNNNITSISNYFQEVESYFDVRRFHADNNQISKMEDFEGSTFIGTFETLSLRKNNIDKIPDYLLSNYILDNNPDGRVLYLGGNKLICDCNSAKVLRLWLLARRNNIADYDQIMCRNVPQRVYELAEVKMCKSQHDWTDYIYYLIASEVLLLCLIVVKVTYDYWVFKTAGYLPWPASKMPKLPCDWLCET